MSPKGTPSVDDPPRVSDSSRHSATGEEISGASAGEPAAVSGADEAARARTRSRAGILASYALAVLALVTINFFLPRAAPGSPISALFSAGTPSYVETDQIRAKLAEFYGLDEPIGVQFADYLAGLAHGDLGYSIRYNVPVAQLIAERLPWTLLLVLTAMALASAAGLVAGVHSGWRRGRRVDRGFLTGFLALRSFPQFFLASLAAFVFAVTLGWFPLTGAESTVADSLGPARRVLSIAYHLVLPASVLALGFAGGQYLTMRAGMVTQLGSDYLLLGRAKGLRERRLKYRYAGRNALLPVVTLLALQIPAAVSGVIFIETVFAYPGMGQLMFKAVAFRDYPLLQGCFLVLGLVVLTANLLADLAYLRLDPRTAR